MVLVKHFYTTVSFEKPPPINVIYSICSARTTPVHYSRKLICCYGTHIVEAVAAKRTCQHAAVCFIKVLKRVVWIHNLIHPRVYLLVPTLFQTLRTYRNRLSNVVWLVRVSVRGYISWKIHYKEENSKNRKRNRTWERVVRNTEKETICKNADTEIF